MVRLRARLRRGLAPVRDEIEGALKERHTPREVAASFALGVFITSLPTLGLGVLTFFFLAYLFASISKIALFASVLVFNPIVKWGVYGSSFWLGSRLLGPIEGISSVDLSLSAAPEVVVRLLLGNLILAVTFAAISYVVAYRLTLGYRRRYGENDQPEERVGTAFEKRTKR